MICPERKVEPVSTAEERRLKLDVFLFSGKGRAVQPELKIVVIQDLLQTHDQLGLHRLALGGGSRHVISNKKSDPGRASHVFLLDFQRKLGPGVGPPPQGGDLLIDEVALVPVLQQAGVSDLHQ